MLDESAAHEQPTARLGTVKKVFPVSLVGPRLVHVCSSEMLLELDGLELCGKRLLMHEN